MYTLTGAHGEIASSLSRAPAPARGVNVALDSVQWTGTGPALLTVSRKASGAVTVSVYRGPLGAGPRVAALRVPFTLPPAIFSLVIVAHPGGSGQRPLLLWMTRGRTGSRRTELHVLPGADGFRRWGEQLPTTLPDLEPQLSYAAGAYDQEMLLLYAIDPLSGNLRIFSFQPSAASIG